MLKLLLRTRCILLTLCCSFFLPVHAAEFNDLRSSIANLLAVNNKEDNQPAFHIEILTPEKKLADLCSAPDLRLSGRPTRLTGNRSIIARCDNKQQFIQVRVSATGTYWVATKTLAPGETINSTDIQPVTGELDNLPTGLILDAQKITGTTPTRIIQPGQPLTERQLRRHWAVLANRDVDITAPGEGFMIHAKGKALENAAINDTLRIQTRTGQTRIATVTGEGKVTINMAN
ncbi:flagellar basal body P-ring formation chaperone FlgA [Vagococcus sp. WN89Y]|uniref:flagellar basal body P-ring formation chaperone FlgA n=1 Tax=Vagococcus sp. WN89Y TaxID=3457258 RepID=UPI003FCC58ED